MPFTVANILTLLRLVLAPVFIIAFVIGRQDLAFIVFCVAGFTDLIDGTVARLLNQPSKGGALLDPIADKILMQSCFTALLITDFIPLWFFLLALARDCMIMCGIFYLEWKKADLPYRPVWVSKFATLFQLLVAVLALLQWWKGYFSILGVGIDKLKFVAILIAAALVITSGIQYVKLGLKILKKASFGKNP